MDAAELTRRRTALGLRRPELAHEVGVDQVTIWRWETGKFNPHPVMAQHVERTLRRLERRAAGRPAPAKETAP